MEYELIAEKRFVNLRIKRGAEKIKCEIWRCGLLTRFFECELGMPDDYDFMVFYDIGEFAGETLTLKTDRELPISVEDVFIQSEEPLELDELYNEEYRPWIHFSSKRGWLNDPNGLICHNGEYHLFYQHNPFGVEWGNMHWGHAVSPDLFYWTELPEALYPDAFGAAFSGSAVICDGDKTHSSEIPHDAMVLIYTASGSHAPKQRENSQCVAFSTDNGRSFEKITSNPVIPEISKNNRDPHVFWYEPTRRWVMTLYLDNVNAVIHEFAIFTSPDLLAWSECDRIMMPSYECPGLCELNVENSDGERKWVFWGAEGCYLVGEFDGAKFTPTQGTLWDGTGVNGKYGSAYAGQAFNNMPDGRCVKVSWMRGGALPDMQFNQFMTLPVEVFLLKTHLGHQIAYRPAKELENLHSANIAMDNGLEKFMKESESLNSNSFDLRLTFKPNENSVRFNMKGVEIVWNPTDNRLECLDRSAIVPLDVEGELNIRIIVDVASLEIFANRGLAYIPIGKPLDPAACSFTSNPASTSLLSALNLSAMQSIW